MEKKTILRYAFLTGCIILLSILLPYLISFVSGRFVHRITDRTAESETVLETETDETDGSTYQVGDPSQYAGDPAQNTRSEEEQRQYEKYQEIVKDYQDYLAEFTHETTAAAQLKAGEMEDFISYNPEQFYEAAATYAYTAWGTDRCIREILFDSITSYTDDNGDEVVQAMVEFLHTSHPETENATQVICIYYKSQGYYYFP